jgi:hypothetical protein
LVIVEVKMVDRVLGIDVSGWQDPDKVDYAGLKAHGFGFVVVKLGQFLTEEHIALAQAAGLEVGGYWWNDALVAPAYQVVQIAASVARFGLRFVALDVEQFWRDWLKYWPWLRGEITLEELPKFTPAQISANALQVMAGVRVAIKVPLLIYTAHWFVNGWARPILDWIGDYESWLAQFVDYGQPYHVTWEQLGALPGGAALNGLGESRARIWQVSSRMIYPGRSYEPYDTDVWLGTQDELLAWLGNAPVPPEFASYLVKVTASAGLRVRRTPEIKADNILGKVWPWSPAIRILEVREGWGRMCTGWLFLGWTRRV